MRLFWWLGAMAIPSAMVLFQGCACTTANVFDIPKSVKELRLDGPECDTPSVYFDKGGGGRDPAGYVGGKGTCTLHVDFYDGAKDKMEITYTSAEGCDPCTISSVGDDALVNLANARADAGTDADASADASATD